MFKPITKIAYYAQSNASIKLIIVLVPTDHETYVHSNFQIKNSWCMTGSDAEVEEFGEKERDE